MLAFESPAAAFAEVVRRLDGQTATAKVARCTQGAIWQRLNKNKPAAAEWVLRLEAATGVSRHDLRPDIYGLAPRVLFDIAARERAR